MKIKILEHTGSFVPGIADVSAEVAARLVKSSLAEYIPEAVKEEPKEEIKIPETPATPPENTEITGSTVNDETKTEGAEVPEVKNTEPENV